MKQVSYVERMLRMTQNERERGTVERMRKNTEAKEDKPWGENRTLETT